MELQNPPKPTVQSKVIKRVQIEGLVVLKLVNHCHSSLPQMVTGELLGLDVEDTLEISACFPNITHSDDVVASHKTDAQQEELRQEALEYRYEMLKQLREVNVESNAVGWYCSAWLEYAINLDVIQTQFDYQQELGTSCVCIVYDPLRTTQGKLYLKALRLKENFVKLYKEQDFTQETIKDQCLSSDDIYEELPIEIHNSRLVDAFIGELALSKSFMENMALDDTSELEMTRYLTKTLESVNDGLDELWGSIQRYQQDFKKYKQWEMYGKDNDRKVPKPSRLDSLLIDKQLINHCSYMEDVSMNNFERLYFADRLQKVTSTSSNDNL